MLHLIPAPVARALLPVANEIRHYWRKFVKPQIYGVSIVMTDLNGSVLLLRHSYGPDVWSLPGGGIKKGEDPEVAVRREVHEELGMKLDAVHALGTIEEEASGAPHTAFLFTAVCDEQPVPDNREVVEARFFPPHSLPVPLGSHAGKRLEVWKSRKSA